MSEVINFTYDYQYDVETKNELKEFNKVIDYIHVHLSNRGNLPDFIELTDEELSRLHKEMSEMGIIKPDLKVDYRYEICGIPIKIKKV